MSRGPRAVLEMLAAIPLFSGCSQPELLAVAAVAAAERVEAGRVLAGRDRKPHRFVVILSGTARRDGDGPFPVRLGPGDFFGEIGEHGPAGWSVVAETAMDILVIGRHDLAGLLARAPSLSRRLNSAAV